MSIRISKLCRKLIDSINKERLRQYVTSPAHETGDRRNNAFNKKHGGGYCVISCKNPRLNHHSNMVYNNLDEVPLASKGWANTQSKGDHFTVNPYNEGDGDSPATSNEYDDCVPFYKLGVHPSLCKALKSHYGIKKATPFQMRTIPSLLPTVNNDRHYMLCAETGCGKTISYLVPLIQSVLLDRRSRNIDKPFNTPKVLILVPNRELAYQVGEIATKLLIEDNDAESTPNNNNRVKILVGGQTKKIMMNPDFEDIDILVGTPGIIGKLSSVGIYRLNEVLHTVLDEADTLTDDSFEDRMGGIIRRIPQSQFIFVSATILREGLPDLLKPLEENLEQIISPRIHRPLLNISQKFMRLTRAAKPSHLLQLTKNNNQPMLVFTNRNETCNWLAMFLRENNQPCANINGDMHYALRIEQWNSFVRGDVKILASTDVASRGLDTTQVRHVLNYDFPLYAADYLHRIGRIGRLGSPGGCRATNFITGPEEVPLVKQIEYAIRRNDALLSVDGNITNIVQRKISKGLKQSF